MRSPELRWGLIIGLVNLAWLYGTYYAGLHTRGMVGIQVLTIGSFLLSIVGYVFALREVVRREPETSYLEGIRSGAVIAGIVAVIAVIAQFGYFKLVNPGWTDYMVEQTREHFAAQGLPADQVEEIAEQSRKTFGLASYMIQSALGAIFLGMLSSAIILIFLRRKRA